jgi:hypothetical protein
MGVKNLMLDRSLAIEDARVRAHPAIDSSVDADAHMVVALLATS